jgi:hypothetical protein
MSALLIKSFSNLKVIFCFICFCIDADLVEFYQVAPSPVPPPIPLTVPFIETHGREMFYGIETTEDWLADLTETNRAAYRLPTESSRLLDVSHALWVLKTCTHNRKLKYERVLSESPSILSGSKVDLQAVPKGRFIWIVSVCSSRQRSFQKRPNQMQMDLLTQTMGGKEARWWVGYSDGVKYL